MEKSAAFAIGIATKDRWIDLERTLTALEHAGLRDVETVVVDDGSQTPCPIDWQTRFPWVCFERSESSRGYIAQRNYLGRRLSQPFYLSLDDDSYPIGGDLESAARWLIEHPEVIALAFRVVEGDAPPEIAADGPPFAVRFYIGCAHLLRREEFLRLGGYREELESYCEEFEFSVRAWSEGLNVTAWPNVLFRHHTSPAGRNLARTNRLLTRNDLWIAIWHFPWPFLVLSFLNCLPRQFRYACHRDYWRSVLYGFLTGLGTLPQAWEKRLPPTLGRHLAWRRLPHPEVLVRKL